MILNLKSDLRSKNIETLKYMTRSDDYDFQPLLDNPFFTGFGGFEDYFGNEGYFDNEWREILANNHPRGGEEFLSQIHRSVFSNNKLCFRILIDNNTYWEVWGIFLGWLFSIGKHEGLVGYIFDADSMKAELIYFDDNVTLTGLTQADPLTPLKRGLSSSHLFKGG
jgi:hypothetical protein